MQGELWSTCMCTRTFSTVALPGIIEQLSRKTEIFWSYFKESVIDPTALQAMMPTWLLNILPIHPYIS